MKTKANVLVLLAAYNGDKFLKKQIDSILHQKNVDIELVISNDCSSDTTWQVLTEYKRKHPSIIKIINQDYRIGSAGKHFFKLLSSIDNLKNYDFVSFSDQDDIWMKNKLIKSITSLRESMADGYSSSYYLKFNNKIRYYDKLSNQKKYDYFFESPGPGCTFTLTKNLFKSFQSKVKKNFPTEIFYHDWLIYAFARSNNYKWIIDKNPSMYYVQHEYNETGENISFKAKIKRIRLILNGWWYQQILSTISWLDNANSKKFFDNYFSRRLNHLFLLLVFKECRRKKFDALAAILSILFLKLILFK